MAGAPVPEHEPREGMEHEERLRKVAELRKDGIDPWPEMRPIDALCREILSAHKEGETYRIAGRLMSLRKHGKAGFCNLQDGSGKIQLYFKEDVLGAEQFALFDKDLDIGDIVWIEGVSFVTHTGEFTLRVEKLALLAKCLYPLPEKFHGLADVEIKHRQRYLDLITSAESRDRFVKRSRIVSLIRRYLDSRGYLEVETPMLHPIPGGAAARPFVTHHNALDTDFYLRIAPELYLKRLVVGGFEKVYELNRNFRNEGVSTRHNPEFTMLEFYTANHDYHYIMDFVERMLQELVQEVCGTLHVPFGHQIIHFDRFTRMSPRQAVIEVGGVTETELKPERIDETCRVSAAKIDLKKASYQEKVFALFEARAEEKLVDPTFIIDYPLELSPLARRDAEHPELAARFELFAAGMELSNGFNELNNPFEQADRFREQAESHASGDDEAMRYDADYIKALEYGLPPTVGVGVGIDRLVMVLTDTTSIRDVILFPALRHK
ncbi:MAG: lysine--tRNA ligase [Candidatus Dependentiae bacterium]|nr:lysine--tRNA ligase [Candidatus Dependentiae bacterium]